MSKNKKIGARINSLAKCNPQYMTQNGVQIDYKGKSIKLGQEILDQCSADKVYIHFTPKNTFQKTITFDGKHYEVKNKTNSQNKIKPSKSKCMPFTFDDVISIYNTICKESNTTCNDPRIHKKLQTMIEKGIFDNDYDKTVDIIKQLIETDILGTSKYVDKRNKHLKHFLKNN